MLRSNTHANNFHGSLLASLSTPCQMAMPVAVPPHLRRRNNPAAIPPAAYIDRINSTRQKPRPGLKDKQAGHLSQFRVHIADLDFLPGQMASKRRFDNLLSPTTPQEPSKCNYTPKSDELCLHQHIPLRKGIYRARSALVLWVAVDQLQDTSSPKDLT